MADLQAWLHEKAEECRSSLDERPAKPPIYLAVILPIFGIGGFTLVWGLIVLYSQIHGVTKNKIPNLNGMLIALPAIFLWIPVALFLSNLVLYVIPPLRKVAERYAIRAREPDFMESQKFFLRVLFLAALVCLPLIVLGFVL